jgi:hypothetical protein
MGKPSPPTKPAEHKGNSASGPGCLSDDSHPFADLVELGGLFKPRPVRVRRETPDEELPGQADAGPAAVLVGEKDASSVPQDANPSPAPDAPFPDTALVTKADVKARVMRRLGRDRLLECLRYCDDRRLLRFAHALADPANNDRELDAIYRECGLSVLDLLSAFRRFQLDLAMIDLFEALPAVSRDAARVALSRRGNCRRCDGLKRVQDAEGGPFRMCPECRGRGYVRVPGDAAARAVVMDAAGVTGKKAVVQVNHRFGDEAFESDISRVVVVPAREVKERE